MTDRPKLLNWRHGKINRFMKPCVLCGIPAFMIDPDTGQPKHKVCAEKILFGDETW